MYHSSQLTLFQRRNSQVSSAATQFVVAATNQKEVGGGDVLIDQWQLYGELGRCTAPYTDSLAATRLSLDELR